MLMLRLVTIRALNHLYVVVLSVLQLVVKVWEQAILAFTRMHSSNTFFTNDDTGQYACKLLNQNILENHTSPI